MNKFFFAFALAFSAIFLLMGYANEAVTVVFKELRSFFPLLFLSVFTISSYLFFYIDSIAKDVKNEKKNVKNQNYDVAIQSLQALKHEVLVNVVAIFCLFLLERLSFGFFLNESSSEDTSLTLIAKITISFGIACFVSSLLIVFVQVRGFFTANEFRAVISGINNK